MSISNTGVKIQYYGNGVTAAYTMPFAFIDDTDLSVYLDGVLQTLGSHYTVSPIYSDTYKNGGVVTFLTTPGNGSLISIRRGVPATQDTDYSLLDHFDAMLTEADLDKRAMVEQQILEVLSRAILFPEYEMPPNRTLPSIADRAGEGLIFDVDGNIIAGSFYSGDPASTWGKTLIDDADADEGRVTIGITAAMDAVVTAATHADAKTELGLPAGDWTISTAAPSGTPADGDVWIRREP